MLAVVIGVSATGCSTIAPPSQTAAGATTSPSVSADPAPFEKLERQYDARVGVSAIDTATGRQVNYRAEERFGYASTLKVFVAAEFLHDVSASDRDGRVKWSESDVQAAGYSPVTSENIETGLTLSQLAEAAVRKSDNTAVNLLIAQLGGPQAIDAGLTELGDSQSEVVNDEPLLNRIEPGSTDDTTTPATFRANLTSLIEGSYLEPADLAILTGWMSGNTTGSALIRAGAPSGWTVADKSGGAGGIRNDIAVVTPPGRDPIILSIFTNTLDPAAAYDDRLVAEASAAVFDELGDPRG
ncbi:class A beta-lactamase [Subtercola boreus]|nr:class A beta-lactamase [Subtercola boreus]